MSDWSKVETDAEKLREVRRLRDFNRRCARDFYGRPAARYYENMARMLDNILAGRRYNHMEPKYGRS